MIQKWGTNTLKWCGIILPAIIFWVLATFSNFTCIILLSSWWSWSWWHAFLLLLFSHSVLSTSLCPPWTVAHQAPLSVGFPRQEHWNGLPFPSPRDLQPRVEISKPKFAWQANSLLLRHLGNPGPELVKHKKILLKSTNHMYFEPITQQASTVAFGGILWTQ